MWNLDPISEARLQSVMPQLAAKVRQMAEILALDPKPIKLVVSSGFRSWPEQDLLYAEGRTLPGRIITNAKGGESWHCYGTAVDCEPEIKDGTIDWNGEHWQWKRMEEVAVSLGLTSGANWLRLIDAPHIQWTGKFPIDKPDDEARQIYTDHGMEAFWQEIGGTIG